MTCPPGCGCECHQAGTHAEQSHDDRTVTEVATVIGRALRTYPTLAGVKRTEDDRDDYVTRRALDVLISIGWQRPPKGS